MPVWWWTFIYMMFVSAVGMMFFKHKKHTVTLSEQSDTTVVNNKSIGLFFALLSFLLLVYFCGQRSTMFDSSEYLYAYENYFTTDLGQIPDIWNGTIDGKGKLYMTILVLFKSLSGGADFNAWFTFVAIIQCSSVAIFLYRYSENYILSLYLFFTSSCFLWLVNGFRQFLAVSVILFFSDYILKRKTIKFLIIIFIAYNIHSSSILWLPVYFFISFKPWSKKFLFCTVIFTLFIIVLSSSSFIDDTDYSYVNTEAFSTGVNPFRVIFMSIPTIIAFWKRREISEYSNEKINFMINSSIITTSCFIAGMFTSGIMGRLPIYFQMFNYILLPWIFKNVLKDDEKKLIPLVCMVIFFLYFLYDMYFAGNGIYHSQELQLYYDEV